MKSYSNEKPLFFLFTCVKDGRKYINKLFDSLLSQTKINFVHYIYEDGSNDPIEDLVLSYKEKVSKLEHPYKVIYEKNPVNIGLNMATKHCIDMCTCPYFIWIDCDNWVDKDFFLNLEKTCLKKRYPDFIKTELFNGTTHIERSNTGNGGDVKNKYTKYQLGMLIRRKYYYCFFAIKNNFYTNLNGNNYFLNEKLLYNDEQVLILSLLGNPKIAFSKKSYGYFLERKDSESNCNVVSLEALRNYQLNLVKNINSNLYKKLVSIYFIFDSYKKMDCGQILNKKEFCERISKIKYESKQNSIDLKLFYKSNLFLRYIKFILKNRSMDF